MAAKKSADSAPEEVIDLPASMPQATRALAGDNYITIAERFGLNASELFELNGQAPIGENTLVRLS